MIARTETTQAYNGGQAEVAGKLNASGLVRYKKWVSVGDGRVRLDHVTCHDQVVSINQPFLVGGEQAMFPGDVSLSLAQRANCRCTMITF